MKTGFIPNRGSAMGVKKPASSKVMMFPAPGNGINAVDPMATMDLSFCTLSTNFIPDGKGLRVRSGYQDHASGVPAPVRTIIPFTGLNSANDRLWGVTSTGIYDFSTAGTGGWVANLTFGSTGGNAGWGVWTNFTADAGTHYGFYADEVNGLYRMAEGGAWAAVGDITVAVPANLVFVMEHKSRLWFVERNTAKAWYLAAGAISGAAAKWDFGNKFQHGGTLVGLWNWTVDGGDGVDDYMVAISSTGDLVVYRGSDPSSSTTWAQIAQYYIGAPPVGRRLAQSSGGDLFVLAQYGVLPMTKLISGRPVQEEGIYASKNIAPLLTADLAATNLTRGWEIKACPYESVMLVGTPKVAGMPYKQYAMSTKTAGWGILNSLEYITGETWHGTFYFGGETGVNKLTGYLDNVPVAGTTGDSIAFSLLTAFSDVGESGQYHRIQFVRPVFKTGGNVAYAAQARYDYNTDDYLPTLSTPSTFGGTWDSGIWDSALWGADSVTVDSVFGGSGIGRAVGVALAGQAVSSTTLLRTDVILDSGGML